MLPSGLKFSTCASKSVATSLSIRVVAVEENQSILPPIHSPIIALSPSVVLTLRSGSISYISPNSST